MRFSTRFFLLFFLLSVRPLVAQEIFPLSEVQPGQVGIARTVFAGNTIEEFGIKVLEVWRNFMPKRNLIIVELSGPQAELTGPARGMSGSPVYINGKVVGALAYGLGGFLKTPVMGVTPIEEMLEIFDREDRRGSEQASYPTDDDGRFAEMALGLRAVSWENFLPPSSMTGFRSAPLEARPFALPLVFSGFLPRLVSTIAPALRQLGFEAAIGGSSEATATPDDLQPGAPVGGVLISGDAGIEAVGTVTYRRGNQILAFGHPFFDNGPVNLPMSSARVLVTLASLEISNKLAIGTGIVGALKQDRTTGIYGVLGETAPMVPVKVGYENEAGATSDFHFSYAAERSLATLMPLFLRVTLIAALESARLAAGENSLRVQGTIRLQVVPPGGHSRAALGGGIRDSAEIKLDDFYSGTEVLGGVVFLNGILQSTGEIAANLGALMANKFQPVSVKEINLHFTSLAGRRAATLEQVWLDRPEVAPGDSVTVFARLRRHQGEAFQIEQRLGIPRHTSGAALSVVVGSGDEITRVEARATPIKFQAQSLGHLIDILQQHRRNDQLYIQLRQNDRGVIVDGEEMPALPPSVYAVLQPQNARGKALATREQVLLEVARPMSIGVSGLTTVKLAVEQK